MIVIEGGTSLRSCKLEQQVKLIYSIKARGLSFLFVLRIELTVSESYTPNQGRVLKLKRDVMARVCNHSTTGGRSLR